MQGRAARLGGTTPSPVYALCPQCCGLSELSGPALWRHNPEGHDYVEAALLVRGGLRRGNGPAHHGSFEEG